jgi:hypothetical protein
MRILILISILALASVANAADITFPAYLTTRQPATTPPGAADKLLILQGGAARLIAPTGLETVVNAGTCSTTYNVNPANGGTILLTLNGACQVTATSLAAGQSFILYLTQSGSTAPTFSDAFKWPNGSPPVFSSSATKYDSISCASPDGLKLICGAIIDAR